MRKVSIPVDKVRAERSRAWAQSSEPAKFQSPWIRFAPPERAVLHFGKEVSIPVDKVRAIERARRLVRSLEGSFQSPWIRFAPCSLNRKEVKGSTFQSPWIRFARVLETTLAWL